MTKITRRRTLREGYATRLYHTEEEVERAVDDGKVEGWSVVERHTTRKTLNGGRPWGGGSPITVAVTFQRGLKPKATPQSERPVFGDPAWIKRARSSHEPDHVGEKHHLAE